ncbi:MAG TPA: hypothetical protein VES66_10460 [Terriglobales bacterium]|nr:hypothetical protein [Terriglobales bacterium]
MAETAFDKTVRVGEKFAESVCDIENAKAAISAAVDEGKEAARRVVIRGRRAAEDLDEDAVRSIRRYPRTSLAVTFGVAMGAGLLLGWLFGRARR